MSWSGNTILITGGATGIGYEFARQLAARDNHVIICGRRENRLLEAKEKLQGQVHVKVCDVASERDRVELAEWVTMQYPDLNMLVNNAGVQRDFNFLDTDEPFDVTRQEIAINLEAPIHLSKLLIPHLKEKASAAIVNVTSGLGFTPMATVPIYCSAKAALHSLSMTMRYQLRETPIDVYEVIPPAVDSELNWESRVARGFTSTGTTAEEFVTAMLQGFEAGEFEVAYGTALHAKTASRAELDEVFQRMNR